MLFYKTNRTQLLAEEAVTVTTALDRPTVYKSSVQ